MQFKGETPGQACTGALQLSPQLSLRGHRHVALFGRYGALRNLLGPWPPRCRHRSNLECMTCTSQPDACVVEMHAAVLSISITKTVGLSLTLAGLTSRLVEAAKTGRMSRPFIWFWVALLVGRGD